MTQAGCVHTDFIDFPFGSDELLHHNLLTRRLASISKPNTEQIRK